MRLFKTLLCALIGAVISTPVIAAPYTLVEGFNVLDTNNAPLIGTNYAATSGQERDIAVDEARGIIYIARGLTTTADGRPGGVIGLSAIVVTNGAREGSNYRDTGLITSPGGWCQSLAYDPVSDKLWVLGGPLGANPGIYTAPGGTLGGAPNGDGIALGNNALTREFQVVANLTDGIASHGRGGQPRGFAVRTVGTNTTVYLGMGNHVEAWSNDQSLDGTNSVWRRAWATLRPPAGNLVSTRVTTNFTGINGVAVDDMGNCFFSVQTTGGRIWSVRPEIVAFAANPLALDFNDVALGGTNESDVFPVVYSASAAAPIVTPPQSITFSRIDNRATLFVSFLPAVLQRAVTRLEFSDSFAFTNGGAYIPAVAIDGFGSGQPLAGQDGVLASMRTRSATNQPAGGSQGTIYTDVGSITNPTHIYVNAFVTDTNKGQTVPTSAILKVRIPEETNAPAISTQPNALTLLEGGTISLSVGASGQRPLSYQWQFNGSDLPNQTSANLGIARALTNASGSYSVIVSNIHGTVVSTQVLVTVQPLVRSSAMTLLWSNAPGSRPYLTRDNTQRGMAYNADGNQVIVVSRSPSNGVYVLDGDTGEDVFPLTLGPAVTGGTFAVNTVGTAEDGHIYVANLAQNTELFRIYRWDFAEMGALAQVAYSGNPYPGNLRWGDSLAVRGTGNDIQILAGSRASNIVALFTTIDGGQNFSVTPISVPSAPNGAFGLGVAFGQGNTFWGKGDSGTGLRLVQFDPATGSGVVVNTFGSSVYPSGANVIGVDPALNLLATVSVENPDNLRLYSIANPDDGLVLLDQELFPEDNENINGTGAVAFGGGKVIALDSNNGIMALQLGPITPPGPARLTIERSETSVTLTWSGSFTLQAADVVTGPYTDLPAAVSGYTEDVASHPGGRFFRLRN